MPTTRPGFIWSGTEWVAIGQEAVVNPFYYQATAPVGAATGALSGYGYSEKDRDMEHQIWNTLFVNKLCYL